MEKMEKNGSQNGLDSPHVVILKLDPSLGIPTTVVGKSKATVPNKGHPAAWCNTERPWPGVTVRLG